MTNTVLLSGIYGAPPPRLAEAPSGARQLSPLFPGATDLSAALPASYASICMLAPPGTLERRRALAEALTALAPGAPLTAIAPKDKGGARLKSELEAFGCIVAESSKSHHRISVAHRPDSLRGIEDALNAGASRFIDEIGLWSQPGIFSWDRIDPGSTLLVSRLPQFKGKGADLGCGLGFLAQSVLHTPDVERMELIDIDRRAIACARHNVIEARAHFHWADATSTTPHLNNLDFVVMNPPFHSAGAESKPLGQAFIRRAAEILRPGGVCWLVANRHLPYEATLAASFKAVRLDHEASGFKIFEARR